VSTSVRFLRRLLRHEYTWLGIYVLIAVIATVICIVRRCNNFMIFRAAFFHLLAATDLYSLHPEEHVDLFKYSPTFALLFAPFAMLPFGVALLGWNLVNVLLIYLAIRCVLPDGQRLEAIQLTGIGLVTTIDGTQSNGLVAALILLAFAALERDLLASAASAIAGGALVKLFPLAAVAFAFPRRDRWRFAIIGITAGTVLVLLPLAVTSPEALARQYQSWFQLGAVDALDRGASVMRILNLIVGYSGPNWPIQLVGTALLLLPIALRRTRWRDSNFRRAFLASLLVYAVIFNHKAEQPSFVIAAVGVSIWYAITARSVLREIVAGAVFISTVPVFMTVVAPGLVADRIDGPLLLAAAACTLAWLTMQSELLELAAVPVKQQSRPEFATTIGDEAAL
jgi:hypothetical protein